MSAVIAEEKIFYLLHPLGSAFRWNARTDNIEYFIIKIIGYKEYVSNPESVLNNIFLITRQNQTGKAILVTTGKDESI
jgi:hypothetical protein